MSGRNPFVDVTQDRFYYDAVLGPLPGELPWGLMPPILCPIEAAPGGRSPPSSSGSRKDNLAPVGISERGNGNVHVLSEVLAYIRVPFFPFVAHRVHFFPSEGHPDQAEAGNIQALGSCRRDMSAAFLLGAIAVSDMLSA